MKKLILFLLFTLATSATIQNDDEILKVPGEVDYQIDENVFLEDLESEQEVMYLWFKEQKEDILDELFRDVYTNQLDSALSTCGSYFAEDLCSIFIDKLDNHYKLKKEKEDD